MINKIIKILKSLKFDLQYLYLKNLSENQYENYLFKEYKKRTGETLNLNNPRKYTEKMQYAKLYLNTPMKTMLSDKYLVREWVTDKIGSEYLIPLIGVWEKFSDIDFRELPDQFVLKLNTGSGANIIVKNKEEHNSRLSELKFYRWMKRNAAYVGDIQPHYAEIEPRILAEKYIEDSNGNLNDYKFICFNGKVYYCWVDIGRFSEHYRNIYDLNWNLQPWKLYYNNTPYKIGKPKNFEKMIEIAKILSHGFSHVRVDLYNVNGKIYFGEMTFTTEGGYKLITPEKYNYMMGNLWKLDNR